LVQVFDIAAQAIAEASERSRIGSRYRREHGRSGSGKCCHEREFSFSRDRQVQQERRKTDEPMPIGNPDRFRAQLQHARPIAEAAVCEFAFVRLDDRHQIRRYAREGIRSHSCRAQFRDDAGDGTWKSGRVCDGFVVFEAALGLQTVHEPGDDRFRSDSAERDEPAARKRGRCDSKGQLREAEPIPSEGNAIFLGGGAGDLVGAVEARPDDQQLLALASALQPRAGSLEPAAMRNRGDGSHTHRATVSS
jgi:hypothetical protein